MTNSSQKPTRGINWTDTLRAAGIPEPPWGNPGSYSAPPPEAQTVERDDHENWMHK